MAHPLDGVWEKLARADQHLQEIKDALELIPGADPDLIPGQFDSQTGHYVFRVQHDGMRPTWLGPLIGDFVHNTKAALDYLIWELVGLTRHPQSTALEFPIFTDRKWYLRDAPRKIRGVPEGATTTIEILQPFYGPNSDPFHPEWRAPAEEPLAYLYELDKRDKHQALNLTEDTIAATIVGLDKLGIISPPEPAVIAGRLERGAVIAALDMHTPTDPGVDVYLRATYDIAFDRGPAAGEPVVQTLDNIRHDVRGRVIPALERYFPALFP